MTGEEFKFIVSVVSVSITAIVSLLICWKQIKNTQLLTEKNIDNSRYIAEKQINASVLSGNRQDWINKLRNNISEILSVISILSTEWKINERQAFKNYMERRDTLFLLQEKILLSINPKEDDHNCLVDLIDKVYGIMLDSEALNISSQLEKYRMDIRKTSQSILKREWERVKRGE